MTKTTTADIYEAVDWLRSAPQEHASGLERVASMLEAMAKRRVDAKDARKGMQELLTDIRNGTFDPSI